MLLLLLLLLLWCWFAAGTSAPRALTRCRYAAALHLQLEAVVHEHAPELHHELLGVVVQNHGQLLQDLRSGAPRYELADDEVSERFFLLTCCEVMQ